MKATIHDVAKRAGVSVATVSRVVNGNYPVRASTREKVEEAIEALEYVPNMQARELNMRHSSSIGVVMPGFGDPHYAEAMNAIEDCMRERSYTLQIACTKNNPDQEMACIRDLIGRNVSGIIDVNPGAGNFGRNAYDAAIKRVPMVFVNSRIELPHTSCIASDDQKGTMDALSHLLWLGHQRILFVRGNMQSEDLIKEDAYRALMDEAGLLNEQYILSVDGGASAETAANTAKSLIERLRGSDVSAIFCCNDYIGLGALNACRRMGKRVPRDISVIGFGNLSIYQYVQPFLTTIDRNVHEIGVTAAKLLLELLEGESEGRKVVIGTSLIERESTGPCKEM